VDSICEAVWLEEMEASGEVAILETGVKVIAFDTDDSHEYFSRMFVSAANEFIELILKLNQERFIQSRRIALAYHYHFLQCCPTQKEQCSCRQIFNSLSMQCKFLPSNQYLRKNFKMLASLE